MNDQKKGKLKDKANGKDLPGMKIEETPLGKKIKSWVSLKAKLSDLQEDLKGTEKEVIAEMEKMKRRKVIIGNINLFINEVPGKKTLRIGQ